MLIMIIQFNNGNTRSLVFILTKTSGYVKTFESKSGDNNKNNKQIS